MKVAVTGILHKYSRIFYNEYIKSLYNQSYKDFDIMLFSHKVNDMRSYYINPKLSKPQAKKFTIEYIKNLGYDILIFTDTDDFFHKDYVKELVLSLNISKISFTDVILYYKNKNIVEGYFDKCGVPDIVDLNYISNKNCIGFGNSGIKLDIYNDIGEYQKDFSVCDWWFFKTLMKKNNCTASFIRKPLVYYRQHKNNINYPNKGEMKLWKVR